MKKLTIYNDPDFGWTVEDMRGIVYPRETVDDALKLAKTMLECKEQMNKKPYGCKCPTMSIKVLGDGCDGCNPGRYE